MNYLILEAHWLGEFFTKKFEIFILIGDEKIKFFTKRFIQTRIDRHLEQQEQLRYYKYSRLSLFVDVYYILISVKQSIYLLPNCQCLRMPSAFASKLPECSTSKKVILSLRKQVDKTSKNFFHLAFRFFLSRINSFDCNLIPFSRK